RECQAEPEFVTKHCRGVSGMVVDRMYSCLRRRPVVICMHFVHGVSEMRGFGIALHTQFYERCVQSVDRLTVWEVNTIVEDAVSITTSSCLRSSLSLPS